jgi:OOP family OmpA-OmpF porin
MKKTAAILFVSIFAASAQAQDKYVGLSSTTSGVAKLTLGNGQTVENFNDPNSWKLYTGSQLTERYGFELGVLHSGTYKIGNPLATGGGEIQFKTRTMYAAATARMPVTDDLAVFGKAGVAYSRSETSSSLTTSVAKASATRPMVGAGVDYKIGKNVSAVLEWNHYGKVGSFSQNKLEAGVKLAF